MKNFYFTILVICLLQSPFQTNAQIHKDALPKLEKSICFGCQLTEAQKLDLQNLVKNYNHALNAYCAWIWVARHQNFVHRPPKEVLHQSRKHKANLTEALHELVNFYKSAGIPPEEILQLKVRLEKGEQQLACDLAALSLNPQT